MTSKDSSFQALRVMLDTRLPASAVIVASSALDGDGQDELAYGVAYAFAETGKRTALISLYGGDGNRSQRYNGRRSAQLHRITLSINSCRHNDLNALVYSVRKDHDVVVVASPPIGINGTPLDLCRVADGVLLAVRLGRKVTADDEQTAAQLKLVDAKVLGVIAMRPAAEEAAEKSRSLEDFKVMVNQMIDMLATGQVAAKALAVKLLRAISTRSTIRAAAEQPGAVAGGSQP